MDQEIKKEFEDLTKIIKGGFDEVDRRFGEMEEKMATQEGLKGMATKEDLKNLEEKMESGFTRIEMELEDIKQKIERLEKMTKEDVDAVVKELFALKRRVEVLEHQLQQLRLSHE